MPSSASKGEEEAGNSEGAAPRSCSEEAAGRSSEAVAPGSCSEGAAAGQSCPGAVPGTGSGELSGSGSRGAPGIDSGGWGAPDSSSTEQELAATDSDNSAIEPVVAHTTAVDTEAAAAAEPYASTGASAAAWGSSVGRPERGQVSSVATREPA